MLILLSPAKSLDFESPVKTQTYSQPALLKKSEALIDIMLTKSPHDLEKMMKVSSSLAELNVQRYHNWSRPFKLSNAKQAIHAFTGDVYTGLEGDSFTELQLQYAQQHLRILSGLYGVLRPLDLMQPYRLEMGTKLTNPHGKNLYEFWGEQITNNLNKQLKTIDSKTVVNLASNEYFKSVKTTNLQAEVINPAFKDWKNGQYKVISFFAKKARGNMAKWLLKEKVKSVAKLTKFSLDGYSYSEQDSSDLQPVFLRRQV